MFLAEAAAAAYYARSEDSVARTESSPLWVSKRDPELGYALNPGVRVSASRTMGDSALYRVTYTTTDDGVRRTRGNVHGDTWLFMGCSFTFGDGVEDDETLPSRFSEQLGWNANVVNLGVSGYGAHQVLRLLETGRLGGAAPPVKHVIYQAIKAHVARTAGRFRWGLDGPAYRISGDSVRYDGPLHGRTFVRAFRLAERSDLLRLLIFENLKILSLEICYLFAILGNHSIDLDHVRCDSHHIVLINRLWRFLLGVRLCSLR